MNKNQKQVRSAIESGIRKWSRIKASEEALYEGVNGCDLCRLVGEENCDTCPLAVIGHGCLREGIWYDFYNIEAAGEFNDEDGRHLTLEETFYHDIVEVGELIDGMISNLREALIWFDGKGKAGY